LESMEKKEAEGEQEMGEDMSPQERAVFEMARRMAESQLDPAIEAASRVDPSAWEQFYKKIMGMAIQAFNVKLLEGDDKWELIPPSDPTDKIALYRQPVKGGFYILKACGTLNARAERVMYLNKDNVFETRKTWDSEDIKFIEERGTFRCAEGDIRVVETHINTPPFVSERFSLGIQWDEFNADLGTYKLVYQTAPHYFHKCPEDMVSITNRSGVWIKPRPVQEKKRKGKKPLKLHSCDCIIIAYVNPGGWIPSTVINLFQDKLRQRLHTYERVAGKEWKKHYGGKNPSRARTPADELEREAQWKRENGK